MLIRAESLRYRASGSTVLRDVDLELESGECVLLTGDNGSGKSTLLTLLGGLLRATAGGFEMDGQALTPRAAQPLLLARAVYLHQKPYLFDGTVADNVAYGLKAKRLASGELQRRLQEALEWSDLQDLEARNARRLSGGEQQRLAIARAAALKPSILLLDEPLAGLDRKSRRQALDLIEQLAGHETCIVLASHDVQDDLPKIDRHFHLSDGHLSTAPATHDARPLAAEPPESLEP